MMGDKPIHAHFDLHGRIDGSRSLIRAIWENIMTVSGTQSADLPPASRPLVAMILDGVLKEGDPLPLCAMSAAEYRVNHLTVSEGYQQLVDEQLVESKRGLGCSSTWARAICAAGRAAEVLAEEWPGCARPFSGSPETGRTAEWCQQPAPTQTAEEKPKP